MMKYSVFQLIGLGINVIRTKFVFQKARIIRFPADIRGRSYIDVGKGFTTGVGCRLEAYPVDAKSKTLFIGENVQINDYVHITAMENVSIGDNVLIASRVYISDNSHGCYSGEGEHSSPEVPPQERAYHIKRVRIDDNVWLGEMVSVLPGVTIGTGTIVGANSVVSKDLPSNVIAVGAPAIPIKAFNKVTMKWEKIKN